MISRSLDTKTDEQPHHRNLKISKALLKN